MYLILERILIDVMYKHMKLEASQTKRSYFFLSRRNRILHGWTVKEINIQEVNC
jgi:hypothetical protein